MEVEPFEFQMDAHGICTRALAISAGLFDCKPQKPLLANNLRYRHAKNP